MMRSCRDYHRDSFRAVIRHSLSEILLEAMSENNMIYDLIVLKGAGHGFRGEQGEQARSAMVAWFDKYLGPPQIE